VRDWGLLSSSNFAFATHVPIEAGYFAALKQVGVRPIPYVTLYQQPIYVEYQGIDLRLNPDWIEMTREGERRRTSFWESEDQKNWYVVCPWVQAYREAICAYVRRLMEMGAAGIFIDNLGKRQECFADRMGLHQHTVSDPNEAFALVLREVRTVVREFGNDKVVLGNSADPPSLPQAWWPYLDAEMAESYICTWVSKERWFDWHARWNAMGRQLREILAAGKAIIALSYLGHTDNTIKDDAFFCYCSARLSGFIWAAGGDILRDNEARILYSLRLGRPQGEEQEDNGVHYRLLERGIVVVNPEPEERALQLPPAVSGQALYDVYAGGPTANERGDGRLVIPAASGRVYLYAPQPAPQRETEQFVLRIETSPRLAEVRFDVDGFDYCTHSGRWTTEYVKGEDFGTVAVFFSQPGLHTVELLDMEAREVETPAGYGAPERLGQFMDPANPTRPSRGRKYRFTGWSGAVESRATQIQAQVDGPTTLIANFYASEG